MAPYSRKPKSLSAGRPKALKPAARTAKLSSQASRTLIHAHHRLSKDLARAQVTNDAALVDSLQAQLDAQGGLAKYQEASKAGQSASRGGDSSRVLIGWLNPIVSKIAAKQGVAESQSSTSLRMLEVGALAVDNACSRSRLFDVTRIDLNAQRPGIAQQDFMQRPLPKDDSERFHCVSLSLVVNYCPDPKGRGDMFRRVVQFLKRPAMGSDDGSRNVSSGQTAKCFPSLFLVLPAPCVMNSRYLDEGRLKAMLESLGFAQRFRKMSSKLVCYLWVLQEDSPQPRAFPKMEVNPGKTRNNFAITLD